MTASPLAEWVAKASDAVSCRQVVDARWSVEAVVDSLGYHLRQHANGARGQRAAKAARLADRFEAIATLLAEP